MFKHRGAILRELLQQRCTSQPANICFVHSYKHNQNIGLLKYIKLLKYVTLIVMIMYNIVMFYNILIISCLGCQLLVAVF